MVEVVPPVGRVVRVAIYVPDVGNIPLFEVDVHALADVEQPIPVTAREIEQLHLPCHGVRIGHQLRRRIRVWGRRECTDSVINRL